MDAKDVKIFEGIQAIFMENKLNQRECAEILVTYLKMILEEVNKKGTPIEEIESTLKWISERIVQDLKDAKAD